MDILESHRRCTRARIAQHPVALCLQDTTELNFNGHAISGLGPLRYEAQRVTGTRPANWAVCSAATATASPA